MMLRSLPSRSRGARGFTLIELLIALAVMLIGLLALWSMHNAAISSNANAYKLGIATTLAQDAMEGLMNEVFMQEDLSAGGNSAALGSDCQLPVPLVTEDGLEELACNVELLGPDVGVPVRVNGLGNIDPSLGPVIFLRTYQVDTLSTDSGADRVRVRVRVTYDDNNTAKRHGVTIGTTRLADRYNPQG
jgi:prepilin-type N-terminal cleavage/methylation domain-containing protein